MYAQNKPLLIASSEKNSKFIPETLHSLLYDAIVQDNVDQLKAVIDQGLDLKDKVELLRDDGSLREFTIFDFAIYKEALNVIDYLIVHKKFDINAKGEVGYTSLHVAANFDKVKVVKHFVESYKANMYLKDYNHDTPLFVAISNGSQDIKVLDYLLEVDPSALNTKDTNGSSLLHWACVTGSLNKVLYLIEKKNFKVNEVNLRGSTPLHNSVWEGNFEIVKYIVTKDKLTINMKNVLGDLPVHVAVNRGHYDIVKYLAEEMGSGVEAINVKGYSPLHVAVKEKHLDIVKYLVEQKMCNISTPDSKGNTLLHISTLSGSFDITHYFIKDLKLDLEAKNHKGKTSLDLAIKYKMEASVEILIKEGAEDRGYVSSKVSKKILPLLEAKKYADALINIQYLKFYVKTRLSDQQEELIICRIKNKLKDYNQESLEEFFDNLQDNFTEGLLDTITPNSEKLYQNLIQVCLDTINDNLDKVKSVYLLGLPDKSLISLLSAELKEEIANYVSPTGYNYWCNARAFNKKLCMERAKLTDDLCKINILINTMDKDYEEVSSIGLDNDSSTSFYYQ
jgi:ankyrin repeat protein